MKVKDVLGLLKDKNPESEVVSSYTYYHDPDNDLDTSETDLHLKDIFVTKEGDVFFTFEEDE